MTLGEAIDAVEETYEFMLAYAAQGRRQEDQDTTGGVRALLKKADAALKVIADASLPQAGAFLEVVRQDAGKAGAAITLVLAQPNINSQLIDNLNASIHVRALLTDLFLLDEALKIHPA
ncbi:MAG TPA: hypothetical protein VFI23_14450 [Rhizomicrobium sp.]|nr:hypothetical protein [Rhizomicrobium sp.]